MSTDADNKQEFDRTMQGLAVTTCITVALAFGKLIGAWNISWWWVFCPFWLPYALLLFILGIILACLVVALLTGGFFTLIAVLKEVIKIKRG